MTKNSVFTSKQLLKQFGNRMAIKRKVEAGELVALGSGLFCKPDVDPFIASVVGVCGSFKKAVISNITAMIIHGLSDEFANKIDVDIPRGTSIRNRLVRAHRIAKFRLVGFFKMDFHGTKIKIYDCERTLCDAYLIDPAGPLFFKALKRYLKKGEPKTNLIKNYDKILGTKVLTHLQQELADD